MICNSYLPSDWQFGHVHATLRSLRPGVGVSEATDWGATCDGLRALMGVPGDVATTCHLVGSFGSC